MCVRVCVSERERERETKRKCVCVRETERERERERQKKLVYNMGVLVCCSNASSVCCMALAAD